MDLWEYSSSLFGPVPILLIYSPSPPSNGGKCGSRRQVLLLTCELLLAVDGFFFHLLLSLFRSVSPLPSTISLTTLFLFKLNFGIFALCTNVFWGFCTNSKQANKKHTAKPKIIYSCILCISDIIWMIKEGQTQMCVCQVQNTHICMDACVDSVLLEWFCVLKNYLLGNSSIRKSS